MEAEDSLPQSQKPAISLSLDLPSALFPSALPTKTLYVPLPHQAFYML
jgi:hypothetical protein